MTIWIDAHLSPTIATWISTTFDITAVALRDLGLRDAEDLEIFAAAKSQGVIFITKDSDFVESPIDLSSSLRQSQSGRRVLLGFNTFINTLWENRSLAD